MIREINHLSDSLALLINDEEMQLRYAQISEVLKDHQNLFILAKGAGNFVGNYIASKFLQVSALHAESYPCAEFRHGPLSMIDEKERTPGKKSILHSNLFL